VLKTNSKSTYRRVANTLASFARPYSHQKIRHTGNSRHEICMRPTRYIDKWNAAPRNQTKVKMSQEPYYELSFRATCLFFAYPYRPIRLYDPVVVLFRYVTDGLERPQKDQCFCSISTKSGCSEIMPLADVTFTRSDFHHPSQLNICWDEWRRSELNTADDFISLNETWRSWLPVDFPVIMPVCDPSMSSQHLA
jgi:hypothetical protein